MTRTYARDLPVHLAHPARSPREPGGPFLLRQPRPCRAPWHDPSTLPCLSF